MAIIDKTDKIENKLDEILEEVKKLNIPCTKPHLVMFGFNVDTQESEFVIQHGAFHDVIRVPSDKVERYAGQFQA